MRSKYGVFIIESLGSSEFHDGDMLSQILELSKVPQEYCFVNSVEKFIDAIAMFKDSNFRYLHISCHADQDGISLVNEDLSNKKLIGILKGHLLDKRIFFSACEAANTELSTSLIKCGAYSLIGSPDKIHFAKAALFWSSFYHTMADIDKDEMKQKEIRLTLEQCVDLFNIPIDYFSFVRKSRNEKFRQNIVRPGKKTVRKLLHM